MPVSMIDYNNHKIINKKGNSPLENAAQKIEKSIPGAIKIDEKEVFDHLDTLVRQSVEDTINFLPDAEADAICNAKDLRQDRRMADEAHIFGTEPLIKVLNVEKITILKGVVFLDSIVLLKVE